MRGRVLAGAMVVAGALAAPLATARPAAQLPDPNDIAVAVLRQVCDLQWVEGVCEATGYPEPQYRTTDDPSPGSPFALRVGAVHNHSGYSDGDPSTRPADYYAAARDGHNTADVGGDTGVALDFLLSSEHSENEKLPITTAEVCIDPSGIPDAIAELELTGIIPPLACSNVTQPDHYRKWAETMAQAIEATEITDGAYSGFTALRGFEWTNDYFNHLGVYFSRNVVNAKIDGSYLTMELFWDWLREPAERGGGSDALVVFNHPGGLPQLSPFDSGLPHNQILQDTLGGANWNDVAFVPDVDERVVGIEVNGGDDLSWYVRAMRNVWHLWPVAAEDDHQREWASTNDGKTVVLTRGRSPRDYYFAFQHHRTMAVAADAIGGAPGEPATYPSVLFWADGASVHDPAATVLGGVAEGSGTHSLELDVAAVAPGAQAVLVSSASDAPVALGVADAAGSLRTSVPVEAPATGESWSFVVLCAADVDGCGTDGAHLVVTAPIWLRAASSSPATPTAIPDVTATGSAPMPATGSAPVWWPVALVAVGLLLRSRRWVSR